MVQHDTRNQNQDIRSLEVGSPLQELAPGEVVEIDQSSWGAFRSDDADISTGGLGPCCGVVVYDPTSKIATVGHFACINVEQALVGEMVDFIKTTAPDPTALQVHLAGLSPIGGGVRSPTEAETLRQEITERLQALGIPPSNISSSWSEADTVVSVDLHLPSGVIEVGSYDISDDPELFI